MKNNYYYLFIIKMILNTYLNFRFNTIELKTLYIAKLNKNNKTNKKD